jgi:hypothetical protein
MRLTIAAVICAATIPSVARAEAAANPVDEDICLRCDDVAPPAVREKHLGGRIGKPSSTSSCSLDCTFDGGPSVSIGASCGKSAKARRHSELPSDGKAVPGLQDRGYTVQTRGTRFVGWIDKDTPCSLSVHWDIKDPDAEAKAIALAQDVAKVVTPEVLAKRRTMEAIVWAQDKTGQRAQAELESWDKESTALRELATFSAGFPQLLDHQSKPGLPEGKKSLILGYCATTKADGIVKALKATLPSIAWYRIPAEGLTVSCPTEPNHVHAITSKKTKLGSEELSVVTLDAHSPTRKDERGNERRILLVLSFLRDRTGRLLASDQKEVDAQTDRFGKVKIQPSEGGLTVETEVDLKEWKGPPCSYGVRVKVQVKDGKIASEEDADGIPSCYCCRGE